MSRKKQIIVIIAVIAAVVIALYALGQSREYDSYSVVSTSEQKNTAQDQFTTFQGNLVQYGQDGILYKKFDGTTLWSQSYEMEQPFLVQSSSYLCVVDQTGNSVYLFNRAGLVMQTETVQQILQADVSDNGTVALILEGDNDCTLQMLDSSGNKTAEGNAHITETGFPIAAAVSSDGGELVVSYLDVMNGKLSSKVTFYDFGASKSNKNHVVASDTYDGQTIPRLKFMGNGNLVAVSDQNIIIYRSGSKPAVTKTIALENDVKSVFFNQNNFGVVSLNSAGNAADSSSGDSEAAGIYVMSVYNANGRQKFTTDFSQSYDKIAFLDNGMICVLGDQACELINRYGKMQFSDTFDETVCGLYSSGQAHVYYLVCPDKVERIRLE